VAPQDADDAEALLRRADRALYRAKANPKTPVRFYDDSMDSEAEASSSGDRA